MGQKLGQHFLINQSAAKKIVAGLEINLSDTIIEIGPGRGELTKHIIRLDPQKIIAVEKDEQLARRLKTSFPKIKIIESDILDVLADLKMPAKIIGNIPYYLTGQLLRRLSELQPRPLVIVLTVQKEVGLRLTAQPPKMNLLAASIQYWAQPEILGFILKTDFQPAPKVNSAIIRLKPRIAEPTDKQADEKYYQLIKILFKQPRKTILNNLVSGFKKDKNEIKKIIKKIGVNPLLRPQNLTIENIIKLKEVF